MSLRELEGQHSFAIPPDDDGYVGRECPECQRYFKIVNGTGLTGENLPCHCAYCGHFDDHNEFHTSEQVRYATSLMARKAERAIERELAPSLRDFDRILRDLNRALGGRRPPRHTASTRVTRTPARHYCEKELEEHVTCSNCTLKYAVYGTFAFCPDCGVHNSEQILAKNFDLFEQMLNLVGTQHDAVAERLVIGALQDAVAAFDGFGRESVRVRAATATNPAQAQNLSFQNLQRVQQRVQTLFGFDLSGALPPADWELAHRTFQKRHVFAHAMGVVDQDYLDKTGDTSVALGQKLTVTAQEVRQLLGSLRQIGAYLAWWRVCPRRTIWLDSPALKS